MVKASEKQLGVMQEESLNILPFDSGLRTVGIYLKETIITGKYSSMSYRPLKYYHFN